MMWLTLTLLFLFVLHAIFVKRESAHRGAFRARRR